MSNKRCRHLLIVSLVLGILLMSWVYRTSVRLDVLLAGGDTDTDTEETKHGESSRSGAGGRGGKVAIVVLGGGLLPDGAVYPHTRLRVERAVELYHDLVGEKNPFNAPMESQTSTGAGTGTGTENTKRLPAVVHIIPLSGGTPHKPPPLDSLGFPIAEATAAARLLLQTYKIPPAAIREEPYSLDTLGNAYFLRTLHVDPGRYDTVYVITNDWHMPRTEAMFRHVFSLPPAGERERSAGASGDARASSSSSSSSSSSATAAAAAAHPHPRLVFESVPAGLSPDALLARTERERQGLRVFLADRDAGAHTSMEQLHEYMFGKHGAYAASRLTMPRRPLDPAVLSTY